MITFRKGRRESELSLMSRVDDRRGSIISLSSLRRQSIDGSELFLGTSLKDSYLGSSPMSNGALSTALSTDASDNSSGIEKMGRRGTLVLPAITKTVPAPPSPEVVEDQVTIEFPRKTSGPNSLATPGAGDDRRVSTASMMIGEGLEDFKANDKRLEKRIWMNIMVMSVAFMLLFSSIATLASLQSSLHDDSLGVVGLAVTFGTVVLSCAITPNLLIKYIGYKWTVSASMLGAVVWMLTNMFAVVYSVIPGAIMLGLSWAPLWTAHSAYVTSLAKKYAMITSVSTEDAITKFFGVFYTLFLTSPVWGNLVSAGVLGGFGGGGPNPGNVTLPPDHEETMRELLKYCGANYCPLQEIPINDTAIQVVKPSFTQIATLVGINVGITFVGFLAIVLFVDKETSPHLKLPATEAMATAQEEQNDKDKPLLELFLATLRQIVRKKQLLLLPFTVYTGLEQAFLLAEFTGAFVACAIGINMVSLTTICFGLVGGIFAVVVGKFGPMVGRAPIFLMATVLHLGVLIFMLFWKLDPDQLVLFFIVPAIWGMGDSVFQSQINSLYGNLFCDNSEAAFASYRMFESIGFILGYGYSGLLCVRVKIYILIALLVLANVGYFIIEIWMKRKMQAAEEAKKKKKAQSGDDVVNNNNHVAGEGKKEEGKKPVKKLSASKAPSLETTYETHVESEA